MQERRRSRRCLVGGEGKDTMTQLVELEAKFVRHFEEGGRVGIRTVDSLAEAQGVMFLCPLCFKANGGKVGTHRVVCWSRSRGVPEHATPKPGRWSMHGTGLHDLTLNGDADANGGGARSVQLLGGGCQWHGFVTNGDAT
jgi:hypothetical protein